MRILVTGANGLVGRAIVSKTYVGHEIIPVYHNKYDLLQWAHVSALFRDTRPDAVVHLAAKVGGVKANMAAPATFFMENCVMNTHVLEACLTYKVKKLVCFLSTCIFPDGLGVPLEPKLLHAGPPHDSNYGYAYAKRMLAVQCRAYNEQYGTNFVSVIPSNIYGPHDNFHPENSHVVPALILKFWEAHLAGKDVTLWGNGKPFREFIYSHDVANLCMKVLLEYARKDPIILSTGREHTIAELAATIATSIGFKGQIHYDTSKPSGQYRKNSDNKPLLEQWPDYQFTDLTGGIGQTVSWFQRVYPYVRGIAL